MHSTAIIKSFWTTFKNLRKTMKEIAITVALTIASISLINERAMNARLCEREFKPRPAYRQSETPLLARGISVVSVQIDTPRTFFVKNNAQHLSTAASASRTQEKKKIMRKNTPRPPNAPASSFCAIFRKCVHRGYPQA